MFHWLLKADKSADVFVRWFGVLALLSAGYAWLVAHAPWASHLNWAEIALSAIGAGVVTFFFVAAGLALLRYYRPLAPYSTIADPGGLNEDEAERLSRLEHNHGNLRDKFVAFETETRERQKAIINDYQRMLGLEVRTAEHFEKVEGEITKAQQDLGALFAHRSLDSDHVKMLVRGIYDAIAAIFHRERLHLLGQHIEEIANELSAPTNQRAHYNQEEWEAWEAREAVWLRTVTTWCSLAENYVPGITANVMMTSDDHYKQKGVAQVDQFPDPEAFFAYKAFCAVVKNFKNWQEEAQRAVHQAAFNGGGRTPMAGGGDMEELGGKT